MKTGTKFTTPPNKLVSKVRVGEVSLIDIWRIRHEVMWPDKPLEFVKLEADNTGRHIGLYNATKVLSVISLFQQENELQFRKFATLSSEQGKGYGTLLMKHTFEIAEREKTTRIWCNARLSQSSFYERFGMIVASEPYENSGIIYVTMEKKYQQ